MFVGLIGLFCFVNSDLSNSKYIRYSCRCTFKQNNCQKDFIVIVTGEITGEMTEEITGEITGESAKYRLFQTV